jgi:hypothetical protein
MELSRFWSVSLRSIERGACLESRKDSERDRRCDARFGASFVSCPRGFRRSSEEKCRSLTHVVAFVAVLAYLVSNALPAVAELRVKKR